MSKENLPAEISAVQKKFVEIVTKAQTGVVFEVESMFAMQALAKNDYLAGVATKNLPSLRNATINVASVGLSLNPVTQYAYLVPRDGAICLDVSYKGLLKLATDCGSILWGRAELVYEKDTFRYRGPSTPPEHEAEVFSDDRGKFIGVYCVAKTAEGDFLVDVMNAKEIEQVQNTSKTTNADTPWKRWFGEMAKKTIIKRASKTWPRSDKNERLAQAIQIVNEHEGIDFDQKQGEAGYLTDEQACEIDSMIVENNLDRKAFLSYMAAESVGSIKLKDYGKAIAALNQKIKAVKK